MTFIRCIAVDFTFGLFNCVRYNEDFVISRFVISRFCSIYFTVTLAGLKNIVLYTEDFVIKRFVKSKFHCTVPKKICSFKRVTVPCLFNFKQF